MDIVKDILDKSGKSVDEIRKILDDLKSKREADDDDVVIIENGATCNGSKRPALLNDCKNEISDDDVVIIDVTTPNRSRKRPAKEVIANKNCPYRKKFKSLNEVIVHSKTLQSLPEVCIIRRASVPKSPVIIIEDDEPAKVTKTVSNSAVNEIDVEIVEKLPNVIDVSDDEIPSTEPNRSPINLRSLLEDDMRNYEFSLKDLEESSDSDKTQTMFIDKREFDEPDSQPMPIEDSQPTSCEVFQAAVYADPPLFVLSDEDSSPPVSCDNSLKPAPCEDSLKPAPSEDFPPPASSEYSSQTVQRKNSLKPASREDSLPPPSREDSTQPAPCLDFPPPASSDDSFQTAQCKNSFRPVSREDSSQTASREDSLRPASREDFPQPEPREDSPSPASREDSTQPAPCLDSPPPASSDDSSQTAQRKNSFRPASREASPQPEPREDSPRPASRENSPQPEPREDSPSPVSREDSTQPAPCLDSPPPASSEDSSQTAPREDSPRPASREDSPQPEPREDPETLRNKIREQLNRLNWRRPSVASPSATSFFKPRAEAVKDTKKDIDAPFKIVQVVGGYKSPPRDNDFRGYFPDEVDKSKNLANVAKKQNLDYMGAFLTKRLSAAQTNKLNNKTVIDAESKQPDESNKPKEPQNQNKPIIPSSSSKPNPAFVSEILEDYLKHNSKLNISYEIPGLEAPKSFASTDALPAPSYVQPFAPLSRTKPSGASLPFTSSISANLQTTLDTVTPYKSKTLAEKMTSYVQSFAPLSKAKPREVSLPQPSKSSISSELRAAPDPIKPYKPKTLAEKRRLLELQSLEKSTQESSLGNSRKQLMVTQKPFSRKDFTSLTKSYSFVFVDGRKIKVATWRGNKILARIKDKRKLPRSLPPTPTRPKSVKPRVWPPKTSPEKPSLLKTLKPEKINLDHMEWEKVTVKLPKISLSVTPQFRKRAHPKIQHLIRNSGLILNETDAKFALTALNYGAQESFTFPVPYKNNQTEYSMLKKISVTSKCVESDEEINKSVTEVINKLLDYAEITEETRDESYQLVDVIALVEPPPDVAISSSPKEKKPSSKCFDKKTTLEMKRLNCKIVSFDFAEKETENVVCAKEFCKFGCICKSIECLPVLPNHCRSLDCMFECKCCSKTTKSDLFGDGVLNRLEDEAKKNLAKFEAEFTQTVVLANDQVIVIGDRRDRRKRKTKTPVKYSDFLENNDDEDTEVINDQLDEKSPPNFAISYNNEKLKDFSIPLVKHDFSSIIPFCMVHSLYRCHCASTSKPSKYSINSPRPSKPALSTSVVTSSNSNSMELDDTTIQDLFVRKKTSEKKRKVQKAHKKCHNNKSFDKEEHTARTRGLPTSYYLERNRTPVHLNSIKKSSKKFQMLSDEHYKQQAPNNDRHISKSTILNQYVRKDGIDTEEDSDVDVLTCSSPVPALHTSIPVKTPTLNLANLLGQNNNFRLYSWTLVIATLNTQTAAWFSCSTPSYVSFTQGLARPSISYTNINFFKLIYDISTITSELIECLVTKRPPGNRKVEDTFFIVDYKADRAQIIGVCEKKYPHFYNSKINMNLVFTGEVNKLVGIGNVLDRFQSQDLNSLNHLNMDNAWKKINYTMKKFLLRSVTFRPSNSAPDDNFTILSPLPSTDVPCKWLMVFMDEQFEYIKLKRNGYTIQYNALIRSMQLAQKIKKTVLLKSSELARNYSHCNFAIYCVPNHIDKIFIGPFVNNENGDVDVLFAHHSTYLPTKTFNEITGRDIQIEYWVEQEVEKDGDVTTIDLTGNMEDEEVVPVTSPINPVYNEHTHWKFLDDVMKSGRFATYKEPPLTHDLGRAISRANGYIRTNNNQLGYIPIYMVPESHACEVLNPLTNKIIECPDHKSAVATVLGILSHRFIVIPKKYRLKLAFVKYKCTNLQRMNPRVLDGYHIVSTCGVVNIRELKTGDLRNYNFLPSEIDYIISQRNKRLIYDVTCHFVRTYAALVPEQQTSGAYLSTVIKRMVTLGIRCLKLNGKSSTLTKFLGIVKKYPKIVQKKMDALINHLTASIVEPPMSISMLETLKRDVETSNFNDIIVSQDQPETSQPQSTITQHLEPEFIDIATFATENISEEHPDLLLNKPASMIVRRSEQPLPVLPKPDVYIRLKNLASRKVPETPNKTSTSDGSRKTGSFQIAKPSTVTSSQAIVKPSYTMAAKPTSTITKPADNLYRMIVVNPPNLNLINTNPQKTLLVNRTVNSSMPSTSTTTEAPIRRTLNNEVTSVVGRVDNIQGAPNYVLKKNLSVTKKTILTKNCLPKLLPLGRLEKPLRPKIQILRDQQIAAGSCSHSISQRDKSDGSVFVNDTVTTLKRSSTSDTDEGLCKIICID